MTHWTLAPDADLRWRHWDGESVVYHPSSGDTHILNPLAAEALQCLSHGLLTVDELAQRVASNFELESDAELHRQMEKCLLQFAELGLIHKSG